MAVSLLSGNLGSSSDADVAHIFYRHFVVSTFSHAKWPFGTMKGKRLGRAVSALRLVDRQVAPTISSAIRDRVMSADNPLDILTWGQKTMEKYC